METQRDNEDLIGIEFTAYEFKSEGILSYNGSYAEALGCTAIVEDIHTTYPQYANCLVTFPDGSTKYMHYHSDKIREQAEYTEDVDVLFDEFKKILHQ